MSRILAIFLNVHQTPQGDKMLDGSVYPDYLYDMDSHSRSQPLSLQLATRRDEWMAPVTEKKIRFTSLLCN